MGQVEVEFNTTLLQFTNFQTVTPNFQIPYIYFSSVPLARRKAMFEVTVYLVLCLLAVEGAITGQSKANHNNVASQHEVSGRQKLGIFTRDENRIDGHLTEVVNSSNVDNATTCPTWFYPRTLRNGSTECECGNNFGGRISCNSTSHVVSLLRCFGMTYNNDKSSLVVGASYYGCYRTGNNVHGSRYRLPFNISSLNKQCEKYNRDGQLCGQCRKGFAPLVYSYNMSCMNCTNPANNWLKYITVAFMPLTVFFVILIAFRIRATSALMNTFILFSQTVTAPIIMRSLIYSPSEEKKSAKSYRTFFLWHLELGLLSPAIFTFLLAPSNDHGSGYSTRLCHSGLPTGPDCNNLSPS